MKGAIEKAAKEVEGCTFRPETTECPAYITVRQLCVAKPVAYSCVTPCRVVSCHLHPSGCVLLRPEKYPPQSRPIRLPFLLAGPNLHYIGLLLPLSLSDAR